MDIVYALFIPILVIGFILFWILQTQGLPQWIQKLLDIEPSIWNFGVILIGTVSIIKYLSD